MIGGIIRFERAKRNMKQNALAKGICSSSYLSKIENNQVIPNNEITTMLLKRLDLSLETLTYDHNLNEKCMNELVHMYQQIIKERSYSLIQTTLKKLQDNEKMYISNGAFYLYTLIKIYISLALKEDKEWVESQLSLMSNYQKEFNWTTIFLYKKCSMLYHYHNNQKNLALSEINELISMIPITLDSSEQADLYFMKARIKYDLKQYFSCIEFASRAVDYYTTHLDFYCVIEALILKGASYKKLGNYKRAVEVYTRALQTANLTDINYPIYIIYQNIGFCLFHSR